MHEHQKQRAQQQLVGHRVKVFAQQAALLQEARQQAIQRVGQPRGHEESKAHRKMAFQNGSHQKRRQTDAQQREQVGSGAVSVESFVGNIVHGNSDVSHDSTAWRVWPPIFSFRPGPDRLTKVALQARSSVG